MQYFLWNYEEFFKECKVKNMPSYYLKNVPGLVLETWKTNTDSKWDFL